MKLCPESIKGYTCTLAEGEHSVHPDRGALHVAEGVRAPLVVWYENERIAFFTTLRDDGVGPERELLELDRKDS